MAFDVSSSLHAIETYALNLGLFQTVRIGEPNQPVGQGFHAAIFMNTVDIGLIYSGGQTRENHVMTLRIYKDLLAENTNPQINLESEIAVVVSKLFESLLGDTDLESTIMSIDAAGMDGQGMSASFGYSELGGSAYRIVDITIPLIVNGSSTLAGTGV